MRVFIGATALCLMLTAVSSFAQAPAPPAAPQPQAAAPQVQRPFPVGTKYAFVNIQRIAAESAAGKTLAGKVQAMNQQKVNELNEKNKALQAAQQKLDAGGTVLSPTAVAQLQKDIERQQIDIQRFTEDAQQDVTNLQTQLQEEFQARLSPVIQQVATERALDMLFSVVDSGLVWADQSLDITTDVIQKFDAARAPAPAARTPAAAAPAARPAAPAPKPATP
ncbi:MAG: OmpH family outer membrane protein [Acidobacteria bacterium]|nr:OmpH family outer membrane protein [Acidobacteriota bacterium]